MRNLPKALMISNLKGKKKEGEAKQNPKAFKLPEIQLCTAPVKWKT